MEKEQLTLRECNIATTLSMKKIVGSRIPSFTKTESNTIKGSADFVGLNYYSTLYFKNRESTPQMDDTDAAADKLKACLFEIALKPSKIVF